MHVHILRVRFGWVFIQIIVDSWCLDKSLQLFWEGFGEVICHCPLPKAVREWPAQSHQAGFLPKVGLNWFLARHINHYTNWLSRDRIIGKINSDSAHMMKLKVLFKDPCLSDSLSIIWPFPLKPSLHIHPLSLFFLDESREDAWLPSHLQFSL